MSNMTKERAAQIAAGGGFNFDEIEVLARIALASLEAEPVAWAHRLINKRNGVVHPWVYGSAEASPSEGDIFNIEVMPLYTAPPAPEFVSDESAVELLATDLMKRIDKITGERHSVATLSSLRVSIVEACRAAMLQGAEPVTTAYKLPTESAREKALTIQLLSVIKDLGLPENCPFVDVLNEIYRLQSSSPVIQDGWLMVPVHPTVEMLDEFDSIIDHGAEDSKEAWSRLIAAAPQQE